jgi:hypothetical protein
MALHSHLHPDVLALVLRMESFPDDPDAVLAAKTIRHETERADRNAKSNASLEAQIKGIFLVLPYLVSNLKNL